MRKLLVFMAAIISISVAPVLTADEGKDESGKQTQSRDNYSHRNLPGNSYFHEHGYTRLDIPEGHYPPPGECRIWYPDRPAGQQPPPFKCGSAVPAGAWYIQHQDGAQDVVEVTVYEPGHPGVIRAIGEFNIGSGVLIRVVLDN